MKRILDFLFGIDRSAAIPPPPAFCRERTKEGTAGATVSQNTGRVEKVGFDADTGTIDWGNVGAKVSEQRRSVERSPSFTAYDMAVLGMPEFAALDEIKYRAGKVVWADGVSNKKAGKDSRITALEGFAETTRKAYWKAYGIAHDMQVEGEEEE